MSVWTVVAVAWVAVFAGCMVGWRLRGSVQARRRGGMVDLTPAASRGELDLDWSDPRPGLQLSDVDPVTGRTYLEEWTRPFNESPSASVRVFVNT